MKSPNLFHCLRKGSIQILLHYFLNLVQWFRSYGEKSEFILFEKARKMAKAVNKALRKDKIKMNAENIFSTLCFVSLLETVFGFAANMFTRSER